MSVCLTSFLPTQLEAKYSPHALPATACLLKAEMSPSLHTKFRFRPRPAPPITIIFRSFEKRQTVICGRATSTTPLVAGDCETLQNLLSTFIAAQPAPFFSVGPGLFKEVTFNTCLYAWKNENPTLDAHVRKPLVQSGIAAGTGKSAGIASPAIIPLANEAWSFESDFPMQPSYNFKPFDKAWISTYFAEVCSDRSNAYDQAFDPPVKRTRERLDFPVALRLHPSHVSLNLGLGYGL
ncbi:hypothetical protein GGX14DRAFT_568664 [Mycena pura]|uniref:Uncharacterized protein n=1 Tax=Mycena pura TaxID=153505 RepID=A0AAD6V8J8_9AGAR|nr:hypothetical protein GGX14DRAFT_568664 [Mycena pura]